jgi:hypothetical protein
MESVWNFLNQGWVGTLVGIAGVVIAILTYIFSKASAKIKSQSRNVKLLGHHGSIHPNFTAEFAGEKIEKLTSSLIVIWNAGNITINGSQIEPLDPLRITCGENEKLLSCSVVQTSRKACDVKIVPSQSEPFRADVVFNFFDPKDGAVLEVLHTGASLTIEGTVRGVAGGVKEIMPATFTLNPKGARKRGGPRKFYLALGVFMITSGVLLIISGVSATDLRPAFMMSSPEETWEKNRIYWGFMGLAYFLMGLFMLNTSRLRYPKTLHIKDTGS